MQNFAFCTPHSAFKGASCRCRPGAAFLQRKPAGCCKEANWLPPVEPEARTAKAGLPGRSPEGEDWSQSPVLPWTQRAYETCLSAGSTAMESAALSASRMSNERSAGELHPRID